MDLLDGLIAGYNCDGDTVDFTGIIGDATAIGSTFTSPGKIFNQAALHDGIDDRWTIPATGINQDNLAFSYGGWNNFSGVPTYYERIMGCGSAQAIRINKYVTYLRREIDGRIRFNIGKSQVWAVSMLTDDPVLYDGGTDYHIFCTYDGSRTTAGMKLYLNGSEVTDVTTTGPFGATPTALDEWMLGSEASLIFDMAGKQNQMLLYDKVVPAANIAYIYNSGAGRVIPEIGVQIFRRRMEGY